MERIIGLICFLSSLCSCSPLVDELSDDLQDDLTCRLVWSGDMERFTLDNKGLRLCDKEEVGGSAFLATPASQLRGTRWEFRVHLFFNPSANNYARFYLASSRLGNQTTKAKLYEISNFPALNNNGGILVLLGKDSNNKEVVIDRCRFSNAMHDASKRERGISLEKRSPILASNKITNWRSSVDETGGTSGMCNSVFNQ